MRATQSKPKNMIMFKKVYKISQKVKKILRGNWFHMQFLSNFSNDQIVLKSICLYMKYLYNYIPQSFCLAGAPRIVRFLCPQGIVLLSGDPLYYFLCLKSDQKVQESACLACQFGPIFGRNAFYKKLYIHSKLMWLSKLKSVHV